MPDPSMISDNLLLLENGNSEFTLNYIVADCMGSFRHYFKRKTHHICIYATLFQSQIYIPSLISGANSKKYKVDAVEPSYYGRYKGVGGGLRKCPYKKNLSGHVIEANNKTWFGEQLKY